MADSKKTSLVPEQQTGKAIDAVSAVKLSNEEMAKEFFKIVKSRLQDVNNWGKIAGNLSASFQLVDNDGIEIQRSAQKGDYFKIDIPGPGNKTGEGYDWVQIEDIQSISLPDMEHFGFRVRPTDNPQSNRQDIAHFYSRESTSTFTVTRKGNKVTAGIYDRNTKPNKDANFTADKIRDAVVGTAGVISLSRIQWKNLTDGLLNIEQLDSN